MHTQDFKAGSTDYQAIILPFESRWHDQVVGGEVSVVFRKKGPSIKANPKWMYAYFGTPISAICAKFELIKVTKETLAKSIEKRHLGMISEAELQSYAGDADSLIVFHLGKPIIPRRKLGMDELNRKFGFNPTPSFIALSKKGWDQLDNAMKFADRK